jgi:formate dehydrogenase (coenzyme F420) alpha subunit
MEIIKTVCGMCGADNCGVDASVEDGRIVDIRGTRENAVNRGLLCPQARAALEMTYDPARLNYPLRRTASGWQRISWDTALDEIADRMASLKAADSAHMFAAYQGRSLLQFIKMGWTRRFLNRYGSPNLVRNDHMCSYPCAVSEDLTYGAPTIYGFEPQVVNCLLLWGSNPATSHIPFKWRDVLAAKRRGCQVIVVDPRYTRTAQAADLYVPIRPGTDAALALALLHVIIAEGLYDAGFVAEWTTGFSELVERVASYSPAWAAGVTGIPAETIYLIARQYAQAKPAYLDAGNALEHHDNASATLRAIMILRAITGNLDAHGGHMLGRRLPLADMSLAHLEENIMPPLGSDRYPIFMKLAGFVPGDCLLDAILEARPYPVRAMFLAGGNPALTWPNTRRVLAALDALDFLVVMDLYMTNTAERAHIVLPAAGPLERTQLITRQGQYGVGQPSWWVTLRRPAAPAGERRTDWWVWAELARRLGYGEYYPWASEEDAIADLLAPTGLTIADLQAHPEGMPYGAALQARGYEQTGFPTPSGKVEVRSSLLAEHGYDPLPGYREPQESPCSAPEVAAVYPLILNAGKRVAAYTHSRHRNLSSLRRLEPEPVAEIHPDTAAQYGLRHGETARISSPRGSIVLKLEVTPNIRVGVVSLLHGWEEANANLLTDDRACDPVLSCPSLRAGLCRIDAVAEPS